MPHVKIKKPHDNILKRLINEEIVELDREKCGTALYFLKQRKQLEPFMGITRRKHNSWILNRRRPFKVEVEWQKQTWFKVI
jgi:hypothetical protein